MKFKLQVFGLSWSLITSTSVPSRVKQFPAVEEWFITSIRVNRKKSISDHVSTSYLRFFVISLELANQEFLLRVTHCLTRYHSMFPILMDADTDMVCKKLKQKCFPEKTDQEVLDYLNQQPQWNPLQQMLELEAFLSNQELGDQWLDAW